MHSGLECEYHIGMFYPGTGLFGAAILALQFRRRQFRAISAPDYFVAEQFWRQSHQIFHKIFFIFYIPYLFVYKSANFAPNST